MATSRAWRGKVRPTALFRHSAADGSGKPKGIDFQYLLSMIHGPWMSRANTIVVPSGKMEIATQLIFAPFIWRMVERKKRVMN